MKDLIAYAKLKPIVMDYLPVEKEISRLPREYLIDLIYSVEGDTFKTWADSRKKERDFNMKSKLKVNIKMSQYSMDRFAASSHCHSRFTNSKAFMFAKKLFQALTIFFIFSNDWTGLFDAERSLKA
jgi:hypothetical protein